MSQRGTTAMVQFTGCKAAQLTVANPAAASLANTPVNYEPGSTGLVYLQADPANAASSTIKFGDADGQFCSLGPGEWFPFPLPIANLSQLYAIGSAAGLKLNVLIVQ